MNNSFIQIQDKTSNRTYYIELRYKPGRLLIAFRLDDETTKNLEQDFHTLIAKEADHVRAYRNLATQTPWRTYTFTFGDLALMSQVQKFFKTRSNLVITKKGKGYIFTVPPSALDSMSN